MLAFIDESGDSGRKVEQGSSRYFVVAMVTFEDHDEAQACDDRITLLRRELGMSPGYEFHFSENPHRVRTAFLDAVSPYGFFYHTVALNKDPQKLYGPGFNFKESLYKYVCWLVFENAKPYLNAATVVIDGSGDRKFRDQLAAYLRQRVRDPRGRQIVRKVKVQESHANNLLQLADYTAGITARVITGKRGAEEYRAFISSREMTSQIWPK